MSKLWREAFCTQLAVLTQKYGQIAPQGLAHLAADTADAADRELRTRARMRALRVARPRNRPMARKVTEDAAPAGRATEEEERAERRRLLGLPEERSSEDDD